MRAHAAKAVGVLSAVLLSSTQGAAQDANTEISFIFNGQQMLIARNQTFDANMVETFATPVEGCEGMCLAPFQAAAGVQTVGEREVLEFLTTQVAAGTGLLVDARLPANRGKGFIPASVNVPNETLAEGNPYRNDILTALGGVQTEGSWDFQNAYDLIIFSEGPSTDQSARLISTLIDAGYPTSKLQFYRGGMQAWAALRLTYVKPQS
ncbi:rhodanese-like domain-containing protein [Aestuariibius sp. HNIBRBA575]|uniref:rhodanese-like domain-containing protein n=1 Tax=Aestuariibius sp. HNIBRBA575 TaxID=3233343 RepID=UPI0034A404D4